MSAPQRLAVSSSRRALTTGLMRRGRERLNPGSTGRLQELHALQAKVVPEVRRVQAMLQSFMDSDEVDLDGQIVKAQ